MTDLSFRERVQSIVAQIPAGRVMTYGDIAVLSGNPRGARRVGFIAHYGPTELPWHRVVNRYGGLASGYHGGRSSQADILRREGIVIDTDFIIQGFNDKIRWRPQAPKADFALGSDLPALVAIVGPTASGKTELSIKLAEHYGGEIICADSRTVYRGLDIGTAKPTLSDQSRIPHHLLDVANPDERFTVADFQAQALEAINKIAVRKKLPIIVGGSCLYMDSVLYGYEFEKDYDPDERRKLSRLTVEELQELCRQYNIPLPDNDRNKRHLQRVVEKKQPQHKRHRTLRDNTIVVGITMDRDILRSKIEQRAAAMFQDGVVSEASMIAKNYGWDCAGMTGNIYRIMRKHLDGSTSLQEANLRLITSDMQLAKRQMTWWRRRSEIQWIEGPREARQIVDNFLSNI